MAGQERIGQNKNKTTRKVEAGIERGKVRLKKRKTKPKSFKKDGLFLC